ncbi:MAG: sulfatase [Candidatus Sumerlaeia bacterium]
MHQNQPNILLILTDQQTASALSAAGNPWLHTPAMDSIAEKGVRFDYAACSWPKCVPSRTSMFYGRMPLVAHKPGTETFMGARPGDERWGVRPEFEKQELSHLLGDAGYDCVYAGKWHVRQWGPSESLPEDDALTRFRSICPINDPLVPKRCREYLMKEHDKPFFLVASFDNPHNIHEWAVENPLPWGNLPEAPPLSELPLLPANFPAAPNEPTAIESRRRYVHDQHAYTPEDWRRFRWAYFRLVEKVDAEIGRLIDALEESGHAEDTLVLFTSDHGDQHGAHECAFKDIMYNESLRVPFLVCGSGVKDGGRVCGRPVSNSLDLYATICDYAGADAADDIPGKSLRPFLEGREPEDWHEYVATQWTAPPNIKVRAIHSQRYKYVAYDRGKNSEQLFDLQEDPGEMVNLAASARYADILQQHREMLRDFFKKTKDDFYGGHYTHPEITFLVPGDNF